MPKNRKARNESEEFCIKPLDGTDEQPNDPKSAKIGRLKSSAVLLESEDKKHQPCASHRAGHRLSRENKMAASAPQVFSGITPAKYATLMEKANSSGVSMSGNSGRASKMGVEVEWNYSAEKQELVLTCHRTPFFVSVEDVNARLRELVNQTLQA